MQTTKATPSALPLERAGMEADTQERDSEQETAGNRWWRRAFLLVVCVSVLLLVLCPLMVPPRLANDHYVYLSHNFLQGKLSVDDMPTTYPDRIDWQGHKYLPMGPLPAVLLIPFLPALEDGLRLVWVGQLFTLLNLWLFYRVLGLWGVTGERRRYALLLFFGGTVYYSIALVGISNFFAHIVAVTFLLLAINEGLGRRRPTIMGLFLGLGGAARTATLFAAPFFVWLLSRHRRSNEAGVDPSDADEEQIGAVSLTKAVGAIRTAAPRTGLLLLGLSGPLAAVLAYNFARFGSPLETGYSFASLGAKVLTEARSYGVFSLVHVPKNLFMMLLQGPQPFPSEDAAVLQFPFVWPSPWGMGLFFTSPALLYAFRPSIKRPSVLACWLSIICVAAPIVTYFGLGWIQFGYRYALDFLPFLLLLAARGLPNPMTPLSKLLVFAGVAVCVWGAIWLMVWI